MDPRLVTPAECFAVSGAWLDTAGPLMGLLQSKDATRGLLGQVTVAHQGLSRLVSATSEANQKLHDARAEAERLDDRHDSLYKGLYLVLSGASELNAMQRVEVLALRDHLFPDGLAGTSRSYAVEAGEAGLLEARLEASHRSALQAISINGESLLSKVEELIAVGKQLGLVEASKKALSQELELSPDPTQSEINEGKAKWFAVANLFAGVVRYTDYTEQEKTHLLAPFEALEKLYQERAKERARKKPTAAL